MKRQPFVPSPAAARGSFQRAPLPFILPSLRREAGSASSAPPPGGIAAAGAKWASPRVPDPDAPPPPPAADPRDEPPLPKAAWGGAGLRTPRQTRDFPGLPSNDTSTAVPVPDDPPPPRPTTIASSAASESPSATPEATPTPAHSKTATATSTADDDDDWADDTAPMDFLDPVALPEIAEPLEPLEPPPPPAPPTPPPRRPAPSMFPPPRHAPQPSAWTGSNRPAALPPAPRRGPPQGGIPFSGPPPGGIAHGAIPHGSTPYGGMPHGGMPHGGMPHGGMPHGGMRHANTLHGGPMHGAPMHGRPTRGGPIHGAPFHGAQPHGGPSHGNSPRMASPRGGMPHPATPHPHPAPLHPAPPHPTPLHPGPPHSMPPHPASSRSGPLHQAQTYPGPQYGGPNPHFADHGRGPPPPQRRGSTPIRPVDLAVVEQQKTIMKTKAEIAHEAHKREEEERQQQQRERAARKLRELEERLRLKKQQEAAITPSSTPAPSIPEPPLPNGSVASPDSHPTLPPPPPPLSSSAAVSPRFPRRPTRPDLDPRSNRSETSVAPPPHHLPHTHFHGPPRRGRNVPPAHHPSDYGPRRGRMVRGAVPPLLSDTRPHSEDDTRVVVRSIIDLLITRAVNGGHAPPTRPVPPPPRRGNLRRDFPRGPRPRSDRIRGPPRREAPPSHLAGARAPPLLQPPDPARPRPEPSQQPPPLLGRPEGNRRAPQPLRPAPWAPKGGTGPMPGGAMSPMAALRMQEAANAEPPIRSTTSTTESAIPAAPGDPGSGGGTLARKPRVGVELATHNRLTGPTSGSDSLSSSAASPSAMRRVPNPPPDAGALPSASGRTEAQAVHDPIKSLTIPPTLGGNVKVLMNPNSKRDNASGASVQAPSGPGNGSGAIPRAHASVPPAIRSSGPRTAAEAARRGGPPPASAHSPAYSRPPPQRRVMGKPEYTRTDRHQDPGKNQGDGLPPGGSTHGMPFDERSRGQFAPSVAAQPSMVLDEKEESKAWAKLSNGPAPPTSFDAIKRAFSNQPVPFALVGTPIIPPVPVVPVMNNGNVSSLLETKHDAWGANSAWSGTAGSRNGTEWWSGPPAAGGDHLPKAGMGGSVGLGTAGSRDSLRLLGPGSPSGREDGTDGRAHGSTKDDFSGRGRGRRQSRAGRKTRKPFVERVERKDGSSTEVHEFRTTDDQQGAQSTDARPSTLGRKHRFGAGNAEATGRDSRRGANTMLPNRSSKVDETTETPLPNGIGLPSVGPSSPGGGPAAMRNGRSIGSRSRGRRGGANRSKRRETPRDATSKAGDSKADYVTRENHDLNTPEGSSAAERAISAGDGAGPKTASVQDGSPGAAQDNQSGDANSNTPNTTSDPSQSFGSGSNEDRTNTPSMDQSFTDNGQHTEENEESGNVTLVGGGGGAHIDDGGQYGDDGADGDLLGDCGDPNSRGRGRRARAGRGRRARTGRGRGRGGRGGRGRGGGVDAEASGIAREGTIPVNVVNVVSANAHS